ncbi:MULTISPECIES: YidB family protein [unclassified Gluconobacter]|uniref:YidB family protein n=1 Tax=unclassified Gluconobacter TaxID=2644261 RepID=UPI001C04D3D3|nr:MULTISPECIES: YidB family protein [unclassified Gluconobacter]
MSGFFGNIVNQAMGALGGQLGDKLGGSFGDMLKGEGLNMLIAQAKSAGLDEKIHSWIGNGENLPITTDELRNLLTNEQIQMIVAKTGLPAATILPAIAQLLPAAVDKHTTEDQLPPQQTV